MTAQPRRIRIGRIVAGVLAALEARVEDRADSADPRSLKSAVDGRVLDQPVQLEGETAALLSLRETDRPFRYSCAASSRARRSPSRVNSRVLPRPARAAFATS